MPRRPDKERKTGPDYRTEFPTYAEALRRLAQDGYREVELDNRAETLESHLDRLRAADGTDSDLDPEQPVRLEPAGEELLRYRGEWLREEPERAPPPEEVDLPPVIDVHRVQLDENGEAEYLEERPFARVRRYEGGSRPPGAG